MKEHNSSSKLYIIALIGMGLFAAFLVFQLNVADTSTATQTIAPKLPQGINLWAVFLTGLVTGGLTCLAVQGGLLAATIAQRSTVAKAMADKEEQYKKNVTTGNALPIASFLIAKLIAYTILGFLLGWLGSIFQLSLTTKVIMQFAVAIFMIGTALNILNVHPIFRYFIIQPPKFLTRLVRKQSKRADLFAPILLGAFTIFIPCGTTQAMMALAIGSGNAFLGAATLFAFILGTSPLFFILGYFATKLGDTMHQKFMKFAAIVLLLLAFYTLDGALALSGSSFTFSRMFQNSSGSVNKQTQKDQKAVQQATITIENSGYTPNTITIKAGSQVKLHIENKNGTSCIQTFTIPQLGIQQSIPVGTQSDITFTAPNRTGQLPFMCSMGMYGGVFTII
ncbi:MAG TPA: sulfite exporter TauE/SafE family protein [Candidatus Saccharimonadales bacterium]|nr:sulfite exporter TauE/SafE family protein [Candidatus Saccharimonadales bacterium]